MNHLEAWIHTPIAKALGWSLIHFLWEGTAIALLVAIVLVLCRPSEARLRYALCCTALFAMAAAFALTFTMSLPGRPAVVAAPARLVLPPAPLAVGSGPGNRPWLPDLSSVLPWVVPFWLAGVLVLYLRSLAGWIAVERLRRTGVCRASGDWQARLDRLRGWLGVSRPVALLESCLIDVPVVMGFLRPVILVPMGLLAGLSADQLESILIHELAHIRRWDYMVNLFQNLLEGLLFYHPAVWWVSGQARTERENCCDDVVVKLRGDARGYAAALATLEQNRWPVREPALAATGGSLMKRIHRLLQEPERPRASAAPVLVAGLLLVSLGGAVAGWQVIPTPVPEPFALPGGLIFVRAGSSIKAVTEDESVRAFVRRVLSQSQGETLVQVVAPPLQDQRMTSAAAPQRQIPDVLRDVQTPYVKWMNEDVAYIITNEERAAFKNLQTDPEREHFIEQFWLRRDPTPGTATNEFQEEHYRRIAYANEHFASNIPGWKTDRGRVYISYGPPDEINSHPSGGAYQRPSEQGGGTTKTFPFEQWKYRFIADIGNDIVIEFVDPTMSGEYRMTSDPSEKDALLFMPGVGPGKEYFVVGEVKHPGAFPLVSPTTVLQALSSAGGFMAFANLEEIVILRGTRELKLNYKQLLTGENREQNIRLEPGDRIVVK